MCLVNRTLVFAAIKSGKRKGTRQSEALKHTKGVKTRNGHTSGPVTLRLCASIAFGLPQTSAVILRHGVEADDAFRYGEDVTRVIGWKRPGTIVSGSVGDGLR